MGIVGDGGDGAGHVRLMGDGGDGGDGVMVGVMLTWDSVWAQESIQHAAVDAQGADANEND